MGRKAGIWWRKGESCWYVKIDGKQVRLSTDKAEAKKLFNKLMVAKDEKQPVRTHGLLVAEVADKFIGWCRNHRAPRTADGYQEHWEMFLKWLPNGKSMPVCDLKPYHVIEYMDAHEWGACYKRNAAAAIQRAFKWAAAVGLLDLHPCMSIPKPKADRRESPVTEREYSAILMHCNQNFADVVKFAWETGARPYEIRNLQPRHIEGDRARFPVKESKGKKRSRVVYLNLAAQAIVERRSNTNPEWVFTNSRGRKWTVSACRDSFRYIKKHVGRQVALYDFRHSFATRKLKEGHPVESVAAAMGHQSAQMIHNVYGHIADDAAHVRKVVD